MSNNQSVRESRTIVTSFKELGAELPHEIAPDLALEIEEVLGGMGDQIAWEDMQSYWEAATGYMRECKVANKAIEDIKALADLDYEMAKKLPSVQSKRNEMKAKDGGVFGENCNKLYDFLEDQCRRRIVRIDPRFEQYREMLKNEEPILMQIGTFATQCHKLGLDNYAVRDQMCKDNGWMIDQPAKK